MVGICVLDFDSPNFFNSCSIIFISSKHMCFGWVLYFVFYVFSLSCVYNFPTFSSSCLKWRIFQIEEIQLTTFYGVTSWSFNCEVRYASIVRLGIRICLHVKMNSWTNEWSNFAGGIWFDFTWLGPTCWLIPTILISIMFLSHCFLKLFIYI